MYHKMFHTKNCINCGAPARTWCGHIHATNGWTILAGFCDNCYNHNTDIAKRGSGTPVNTCRSVNPSSCYGLYDFNAVELREPMTQETIASQHRSEAFSARIDRELRQGVPMPMVVRKSLWSALKELFSPWKG